MSQSYYHQLSQRIYTGTGSVKWDSLRLDTYSLGDTL